MAPAFSQMPTLGEFIARARTYGYMKHTIGEPGDRIVYLRREKGSDVTVVDLPPFREGVRLTGAVVRGLCRRTGIPEEDFGL